MALCLNDKVIHSVETFPWKVVWKKGFLPDTIIGWDANLTNVLDVGISEIHLIILYLDRDLQKKFGIL